jgi:sulfur-oxidizing protein SoxY
VTERGTIGRKGGKKMGANLSRRGAVLAAVAFGTGVVRGNAQTNAREDPWQALSAQIFDGRTIKDGSEIVRLDAPYRAEDAAIVPITIHNLLAPGTARRVVRFTLVIDENPAPVAATFVPGPESFIRALSTRVRVDAYTTMHVVAEMEDGSLAGVQRFVKAAGGCSAPAPRLTADAIPLGTMRLRRFPPDDTAPGLREAQLMIRHPNTSGMQMDQLTRLYVPARFVTRVRIWQGETMLLAIETGISVSENPDFRFTYRPTGAASIRAEAVDSDGRTFTAAWSAENART